MGDFFEIDFLDVESAKSGDAIAIRYQIGDELRIHVVDGGFQETGAKLRDHIRTYYGNEVVIDRVVVTHPDGDHAGGLRTILEEFYVSELWMLRPWLYSHDLIDRFARFTSIQNLERRLRDVYPNLAALEEIAEDRGIPIYEPFQGQRIGEFLVLAPTYGRYLDLIVESERTPEGVSSTAATFLAKMASGQVSEIARRFLQAIRSAWGEEVFSSEETSAENEMSVVQHATLCGKQVLLTGDAGRGALIEAARYAISLGCERPALNLFQVPHHGSRRNVSTSILDYWLGPRLTSQLADGVCNFDAVISSAKLDEDHPRKAVVRAMIHRGGRVSSTEGNSVCYGENNPSRSGWSAAQSMPYPTEQEE